MLPVEPEEPVDGNGEVVAMFERWLARARLGKLDFAALVTVEQSGRTFQEYAGTEGREFITYWSLDMLKNRIMKESQELVAPPPDLRSPANSFCYPIAKSPCSFDFAAWLVIAEMTRLRENAPGPLRVGFRFGLDGNVNRALRTFNRKIMFENVLRPMLGLIGAVEDLESAEKGRVLEVYTFHPVTNAARAGEKVPTFRASKEALEAVELDILAKGPCPVVITLREAQYETHRNSNFGEWLRFAEYLRSQGERVIFVRDHAKATEGISGFEVCPAAALDLDVRMALYETCKCSLTVANGPWCLNLFGLGPWISFVKLDPMDPYQPNTPNWYKIYHGVAEGDQYLWSRPDQRIIWKTDTFENLCEAWEQMFPLVAEAAE